jgi:hypothetical protein
MQPYISQAFVATWIAERRQQAEIARLAGDVKRARRRGHRRPMAALLAGHRQSPRG